MLRRISVRALLVGGLLLTWSAAAPHVAAASAPAALPMQSAGAAVAGPVLRLVEAPVFRLQVPFRTQKDGSRWQTSNCGPATLGMLLDGFGIADQATDDLRLRAHTYQGTVGMRTGTGLDHVAHVADDLGLTTYGLFDPDGAFHHWSVPEITAHLRDGHPVMPLVRLYLVPGYEGLAPRWGHYILLTGLAPDGSYFSDPLKTDPLAGTTGVISERQLTAAIENSHIPGQAVAYSGPRPLDVWLPDR
ncbi:MAG: papain-like cysteine protease family protein [Chloroflexota bacterium]